jgi:hypothetical protein
MITNAIISVFASVAAFLLGLLPSWTLPSWLTGTGSGTLSGWAGSVGAYMRGWDGWIPWSDIAIAVGLLFAVVAIVVGVRIAMWAINAILSVIP